MALEQTRAYQLNRALEKKLQSMLGDRPFPIKVLEAGCGSTAHINIPESVELTGIDISESQLARNEKLQHRICGDLQKFSLGRSEFDVIVCWDVIEHLARPLDAIANMAASLRPGGVLVLAFPNLWSLKGLITKLTPFKFHEWFYRRIMNDRSRAETFGQFPTYLRLDIAPIRLRKNAAKLYGLKTEYFLAYEGPVQEAMRARHWWSNIGFALLSNASRVVTAGRFDLKDSDCHLLLIKS